jgi:Tfp pilus assembly protein PilX
MKSRRHKRRGKSERGIALVAALLLMAVMSGLVVAMTMNGKVEVAMSDNEELYEGARAAAESGLNHAASIIMGLANVTSFSPDTILAGPDGLVDGSTPSASVNADNGLLSSYISGTSPYPVATGSEYSYSIRVYDDDDPVYVGSTLTSAQLTAMGPPPEAAEDGLGTHDVNKRIVIRAIGYGPHNTTATLEQILQPVKMPALLVDGDLELGGSAQIIGSQGSVHANGNINISGNSMDVSQNVTATGTITSNANWEPGGMMSGGMPKIPLPNIHAIDYFNDADFVLQANGTITNKTGSTTYCNAYVNSNACKNVTPPGGTASFGWTFQPATGWDLSANAANSATYYAKTNIKITGNPGSPGSPIALTVIAEGSIEVEGNGDLMPEPASEIMFVTDMDLKIHGTFATPLNVEGRILVREQIDFYGNPTLAGQVIVQNVPTVCSLVTNNTFGGNVTLSYNGLVETIAYTVSGWREAQ